VLKRFQWRESKIPKAIELKERKLSEVLVAGVEACYRGLVAAH
jgi:hypothetical protein